MKNLKSICGLLNINQTFPFLLPSGSPLWPTRQNAPCCAFLHSPFGQPGLISGKFRVKHFLITIIEICLYKSDLFIQIPWHTIYKLLIRPLFLPLYLGVDSVPHHHHPDQNQSPPPISSPSRSDETSPEGGFCGSATLSLLPRRRRLPGLHLGSAQPHCRESGMDLIRSCDCQLCPGIWLFNRAERWFPVWCGGGAWQLDRTHWDGSTRGGLKIHKDFHQCNF